MSEHPILFSAPMVRAILGGRKTMTRRVIKGAPIFVTPFIGADNKPTNEYGLHFTHERVIDKHVRCPYGQPGDRLWVRETFADRDSDGDLISPIYRADCEEYEDGDGYGFTPCWRPSIFMPRWASRLTLEIVSVRVERLQDIGQMDVIHEGMTMLTKDGGRVYKFGMEDKDGLPGTDDDGWEWQDWNADHAKSFARLWDSTNAKRGYGWDANPWVWVIEFKKVEPCD